MGKRKRKATFSLLKTFIYLTIIKIVTIVGARPQFIKSAVVSNALREHEINEFLVHTGQHFDENMSKIFFDEMGISKPQANLESLVVRMDR